MDQNNRKLIRLKDYNYSNAGYYFITICAHERQNIFGEIKNGAFSFSMRGRILEDTWREIKNHFNGIDLDQFVVMPNHIHGVIIFLGGETPPLRVVTLGQVVAYYKYQTTKIINQAMDFPGCRVWQRNYYEHVIRDEESLNNIRQYIISNPASWDTDPENIKCS